MLSLLLVVGPLTDVYPDGRQVVALQGLTTDVTVALSLSKSLTI